MTIAATPDTLLDLSPVLPLGKRIAILAEGRFEPHYGKTAMGVIRYGRDEVVAVIDSTNAPGIVDAELGATTEIPFVATLRDALAFGPNALLIGAATVGGGIPAEWRPVLGEALEAGLDLVNGLHVFLGEDPQLAAIARRTGHRIYDVRRPPEGIGVASGAPHPPGTRTVLTVGTDCAVGKMSVALELRSAARARGLDADFVPTGQTGIMIEGWGITVDRVIGDFMAGATEAMVLHAMRDHDLVFVEGQGSLAHPAYSGVTLALIHGSRAEGLVLCHDASRTRTDLWNSPIPSGEDLRAFVALHETMAGLVYPSRIVAAAVNTSRQTDSEAERAIRSVEAVTELPADDPIRNGPDRLLEAVLARTPVAQ
ncbi:MAG: DUF1611 domain-containing protein [Candidatus Limnocylindria bacterium]